jgi:hypothetical protein
MSYSASLGAQCKILLFLFFFFGGDDHNNYYCDCHLTRAFMNSVSR